MREKTVYFIIDDVRIRLVCKRKISILTVKNVLTINNDYFVHALRINGAYSVFRRSAFFVSLLYAVRQMDEQLLKFFSVRRIVGSVQVEWKQREKYRNPRRRLFPTINYF